MPGTVQPLNPCLRGIGHLLPRTRGPRTCTTPGYQVLSIRYLRRQMPQARGTRYLRPQRRVSIALRAQHAHETSILPDVSARSPFVSFYTADLTLSCYVSHRRLGQALGSLAVPLLGLLWFMGQLMLITD